MVEDDDELLHIRMLPEPTLTFTLPSVHDGTTLDCRVFHPLSLDVSPNSPPWQRNAAIVAHPYAPLGGSYDDPIVDLVASTLLRLGYLVCTFNFRGASNSAGRTSWTGKAERADYMSVVGFVSHYIHFLDPFPEARFGPRQPEHYAKNRPSPILLLAGYSYGAMITTQLPGIENILATFSTPASRSPAAEIRLRAQHMADTENTVLGSARAAALDRQNRRSPRKALTMRIGGDEQNRKSHEASRRSFSLDAEEKFRDLIAKARKGHNRTASSDFGVKTKPSTSVTPGIPHKEPQNEVEGPLQAISGMTIFRPAYLLISPLQGPITYLATMSFPNLFAKRSARPSKGAHSRADKAGPESERAALASEAEQKLARNPTLAVYGDQDVFVAAKRLREWASRLERVPESKFRAHEISTAGHFWAEERVAYIMKDAVRTFAEELIAPESELHVAKPL